MKSLEFCSTNGRWGIALALPDEANTAAAIGVLPDRRFTRVGRANGLEVYATAPADDTIAVWSEASLQLHGEGAAREAARSAAPDADVDDDARWRAADAAATALYLERGAEAVAFSDLQSHRQVTLLQVRPGTLIERFGYRGRSSQLYRIDADGAHAVSAVEALLGEAS